MTDCCLSLWGVDMRARGSLGHRNRSAGPSRRVRRAIAVAAFLLPSGLLPTLAGNTTASASPTAQDLGTLGGSYSIAEAVNQSGQVVGYSAQTGGFQRAF